METDTRKRTNLKKLAMGVGIGALALSQIPAVSAIPAGFAVNGKRLTDSYTAVVGKSGNVDYLTTDYASDGAAIQAAIDAVSTAGGGTVLIREGNYAIAAQITGYDNLSICGSGIGKTIFTVGGSFAALYFSGKDNIKITDIEIDGNGTDVTPINVYSATNVLISDVYIYDANDGTTAYGIYCEDSTEITLKNIIISSTSRDNIQCKGCTNVIIDGCVLKSSGVGGYGYAIDCHASSTPLNMYNVNISNCIMLSCYSGLNIEDGDDWTISNVIIKNSTVLGISIKGTINRATFTNLSVYNSGEGNFNTYNGTAITGLIISNSIFDTTGAGNYDNIYLKYSTDAIISNCISKNAGRYGINVNSIVSISGSTITDNTDTGIILGNNVSGCAICGNTVSSNGNYGIYEGVGCGPNIVSDNIIISNTTAQFLKNSASTSRIINNMGYNPVGNFTAPSVPASEAAYTNTLGYPCMVSIYGGTVTVIAIDGVATGQTSGVFIVPPGKTITLTYSAAPTWTWMGL